MTKKQFEKKRAAEITRSAQLRNQPAPEYDDPVEMLAKVRAMLRNTEAEHFGMDGRGRVTMGDWIDAHVAKFRKKREDFEQAQVNRVNLAKFEKVLQEDGKMETSWKPGFNFDPAAPESADDFQNIENRRRKEMEGEDV